MSSWDASVMMRVRGVRGAGRVVMKVRMAVVRMICLIVGVTVAVVMIVMGVIMVMAVMVMVMLMMTRLLLLAIAVSLTFSTDLDSNFTSSNGPSQTFTGLQACPRSYSRCQQGPSPLCQLQHTSITGVFFEKDFYRGNQGSIFGQSLTAK